jgi:transposase InsO family protein
MQLHRNAKTTPRSREEIARRIVKDGLPIQQVARGFGVSRPTVRKWTRRWLEEGPRGLLDRPSAPHRIPHRTPRGLVRRIERLRRRRWVAWQIARAVRLAVSTVSAVLQRLGLNRLRALDPAPPPPQRYERERPGELLHVDVKKLGRIRGVGHRITGQRQHRTRGIGWEFVHVCVDDYTRLAYAEILPDERKQTCVGFLRRAVAWYRRQRIQPEQVMTDNGSAYRSVLWRHGCQHLGLRHLRTRPYTPRTNGKAERFIQTSLRRWAYVRAYRSSAQRQRALGPWLQYYNAERPHRELGMIPPRQRLRINRKQRA